MVFFNFLKTDHKAEIQKIEAYIQTAKRAIEADKHHIEMTRRKFKQTNASSGLSSKSKD